MKVILLAIAIVALMAAGASAASINSQGTGGAPVSVVACSSGATKTLAGNRARSSWTLMPEAAVRCTLGTSSDGAPNPEPSATVGFLFNANSYYTDMPFDSGSISQRLDCCGVAAAASVDTWEE